MKARTLSLCLLLSLFGGTLVTADQPADTRMRDALRNTMLQLRNCQGDQATLQAAKAEADEVNKGLTEKVDSLTAQNAKADKLAAAQTAELLKYREAIGKWQAAYQKATTLAGNTESERAKLASKVILLQRQVDDQQRKNLALYKIGNEILTRYEHFGLGDALAAKEPFVGVTRVKLQNFVQDYRDKLADQEIKH